MRRPDVGGPELHPKAGASAVGARSFLIAYNVYIGPAGIGPAGLAIAATDGSADLHSGPLPSSQPDIAAARAIARDIRDARASSGGLHGVKAIGVVANGRAQVSMNITDYRATPMRQVYESVSEIARRHGVAIVKGELIGLIPEAAFEPDSDWVRQTYDFDSDWIDRWSGHKVGQAAHLSACASLTRQ
jgi:glutamate formiminotransferase